MASSSSPYKKPQLVYPTPQTHLIPSRTVDDAHDRPRSTGRYTKNARAVVLFCIVGVISAAIDFGAMHFLETSGANTLISRAISYILGSLFAYYANSFVTFSGNRSTTEKLRAFIVYTACLIMAVLVNKLARIPLADFEHTVFLSWVISQATATTLNFILQSKWVFTSENTLR